MSVQDLVDKVASMCPEGTPIPSPQWVKLQFWPKNPIAKASLQYTGKLRVKFMVEAHQTRMWYQDAHYASAIFHHLKMLAIQYRDLCELVFMDDKHKCKVGEPNAPVAAVERGKAVVVSVDGKKFSALDHDFTRCSITPSVTMFCHIPKDIEDSFYRGNVHVGLKDSTFQPSSANRHAAELSKLLSQRDEKKPILFLYTDGGGDHNVTHVSTQISLINVFLKNDLDMLQAVRTPPYHSWKNPVERVNCILNLGLQSVGLMRASMNDKYEAKIKSCKCVKDIRTLAQGDPNFKECFLDSLEPVKALLSSVFQRLQLKYDPFQVFMAASDSEIEELQNNILSINGKTNSEFIEHCCHV